MSEKGLLFIDDTPAARDSYVLELEDIFGDEVTVLSLPPSATLDRMLEVILGHPNLASLVVDERLHETGLADYTGIALAEVVRSRFPKLPIYILTNYPEDIIEGGFNVEYVFDKNELTNGDYKKTASARVRRHLDVYDDIFSEREQRYAELLPKYLSETLTGEETKEFHLLEASRIKPLSHEFIEDGTLKKELDEQAEMLKSLREKLEREE